MQRPLVTVDEFLDRQMARCELARAHSHRAAGGVRLRGESLDGIGNLLRREGIEQNAGAAVADQPLVIEALDSLLYLGDVLFDKGKPREALSDSAGRTRQTCCG